MNEPVIAIRGKTVHNYRKLYQSSCACRQSFSKVSFVYIKLSHIFGHVLMVNSLCYGRCSVKKLIPLCTFLKFHTHLEEISKIISNYFWQVFKGLKSCIFKKSNFSWTLAYFRVCCSLKKEIPISVSDVSFIPCSLLNSWGRCLQTRTNNRAIN